MTSSETGRAVCPSCGESVSGNFCSTCGVRLAGNRKAVLEDLPLIGEPIGLARAFWRTTRAPIVEPVRVAALIGDKSPYKFLIAGAGMFIGFFLAMEAMAKSWGVAGFTREQEQFLSVAKYAIFIHLAVAAAAVYAAFALIAGRKVSVRSHARLWALLGGYYLTAETMLLITAVVIYIAIFVWLPALAPATLSILSFALAGACRGWTSACDVSQSGRGPRAPMGQTAVDVCNHFCVGLDRDALDRATAAICAYVSDW